MTFREKSALATALTLSLVYGLYAWRAWGAGLTRAEAIPGMVGVVLAQAIVVVVAHIALAIHRRPERPDERDQAAALHGLRNAYYVLLTGAVGVLWLSLCDTPGLTVAHAMLASVVLAEIVRHASQVLFYRWGY
ncbi:hypothetical protein [Nitrospirillum sp. BR 11828]|uniref:hypothetical protein n=1 Tax=Nitrospirillum sp. BR 11828 TaxID=3104325 RepID=UPI002ACAED2D|nr:hypothetical protein [Nitrospirillum sp. BR 11828]MDZ5648998.1 hypothetical protein [Nitrospirillum sp. BR 11828]